MDNHPLQIYDWLKTLSAVTAFTGTERIYPYRDRPKPGYRLEDGGAIAFKPRPGPWDESGVVNASSYQFKFYHQTERLSWNLYRAFHDAVHGQRPAEANIARIWEELSGEPIQEIDTEWFFTLAFYGVRVRDC